ncbi:DUF2871 domain-containing protein [Paeniglutamicibacter cryotolerans]|uniref:Putative integral membrane protein n=1 Tax=Paeniglutamicibacter cryotolerans TaxID=670079 RepID=A0A839QFX7_9MICC|nr:DUF2871 domain-containing protein [Paeniglutamicibacter cryotolerans]MBB2995059.1 putative integral membrane protein [Paeniglutamicibacter cryotolerans]
MLRLFYTSFSFGIVGILSGLYYRELTKAHHFTDRSASQLGLVHSHFLVLGFVILLLVLALEKLFSLSGVAPKLFNWFFWTWTIGVAITGGMMAVKGSLVVVGADAGSAALSGIAGLGHICLTAGFVLLFLAVRRALVAGNVRSAPRA